MNTESQFGNYLLLAKLGEDSLGETYYGRRKGSEPTEPVLLRIWNGPVTRTRRAGQSPELQALVELTLGSEGGNALDSGKFRGVTFAAYAYRPALSLAKLLATAATEPFAPPLALGLVREITRQLTRSVHRPLHGFLVPQLVMLSSEGEVEIQGFEAAAQLRSCDLEAPVAAPLTPYLSSNAVHGQAPEENDDVHSLGAILFELLTGLYPGVETPPGSLDEALAANGEPLAPELTALLESALLRATRRPIDREGFAAALDTLLGAAPPAVSVLAEEIRRRGHEAFAHQAAKIAANDPHLPVTRVSAAAAVSTVEAQPGPLAALPPPETRRAARPRFGWAAVALLLLGGGAVFFLLRARPTPDHPGQEPPTEVTERVAEEPLPEPEIGQPSAPDPDPPAASEVTVPPLAGPGVDESAVAAEPPADEDPSPKPERPDPADARPKDDISPRSPPPASSPSPTLPSGPSPERPPPVVIIVQPPPSPPPPRRSGSEPPPTIPVVGEIPFLPSPPAPPPPQVAALPRVPAPERRMPREAPEAETPKDDDDPTRRGVVDRPFKVIVNSANPVSSLPRSVVSEMFLKRELRWDGGEFVVPIDLDRTSAVRDSFSQTIHQKSTAFILSLWQRMIFSGKLSPPIEHPLERFVIAQVAGNRWAIGYVAGTTPIPPEVKILSVVP